jgi:large subunit ribosomal protein L9
MKIILRKDVPKLGEVGTVHTVADGYARNYLIPQGMAILATPGELKVVATNQKVADRKIARQEEQLQSLADKISGQRLTFTANTGEQGRLYGSITAGDIADELSKAVGSEIDRRKVALEDPIRSVGEHTITVHLVGKLRPQVTVIVVSDKVDEPAEETETAETEDAPETEESPAEEA